ncbi:MAG TPA: carboxymuconolactone decarboxylase family protein [Kofleriaceae bacterium]
MHARLEPGKLAPDAYRAVAALEQYVQGSGLPHRLIHLLKLRASQLNGCAYCVDLHTKEARKDGLSEQWIALIAAWHESPVFTPEERAVLAWTESLTNLPQTRAPDADFAPLREHFTDEQIVKLTVAIGTINIWNRIAVGFRLQHPIDK